MLAVHPVFDKLLDRDRVPFDCYVALVGTQQIKIGESSDAGKYDQQTILA